ncbi:coiled-coil domain-containing protein 187 [Peromyscus eremicus]|uniref:coiled-coil domain-containing protein 187 n=1 Tax=Peromyscus eremicus TaxID=42410 RepID=UPI0027DCC49F|nr:coiled-coil domain-containing protein 187 [Peromyscus eremicus]
MPTPAMGVLPTSRRVTLQTCPRDNQQGGLYSLKASGRMANQKASTNPREEVFHSHEAKDSLLATLRWPMLSQQLGTLWTVPHVTWSDYIKEPGPSMKACHLPMWSPCWDTRDANSSVSSGRISGSSGGHESCALFHGPWKERPPLVLGPQRQPRKSNPRLEQLRDRIRAQAQRQASCASLGTSVPSSASCIYKTPSTVLRRKNPKGTNAPPVPTCPGSGILHATEHRNKDRVPLSLRRELSRTPQHHTSVPRTNIKRIRSGSYKREIPKSSVPRRTAQGRDSELTGVYAWRKGQALVRRLLGPPPALSRLQSKAPAAELGSGKKAGAVGDSPAHTWLPKPTRAHRDQQVSEHTPSLAIHDQSATIQGAMEILQDLHRQIQAGLELARRPRKLLSSKPQNPAGKRQQGPQSTWDMQGPFSKSAWAATEGTCSSLDRARNLHSQQHKEAVAEQESCPQRAWTAQGQDASFQGPGSTPEKPSPFSQRPWSALAWQTCPQRAWEAQGQDTSFQRSGSPIKKPSPFSERPWSALAGQACSQRTHTACKDWEVPGSSPWSSVARPQPALQQPWSSSPVQRSSLHSKGECVVPPLSEVKLAWPETAQGFPQSKPAKEQDTRESPPCPRPLRSLGQPHSSESLRDFMRQKARARRQQAMEQKALAAHALELRNQRLQEVYRKQREAILGKAIPVVSQRSPGIVTFVPSTVQSGGLEAPGSLGSPLRKWSKVTSGMVLGDREAPDSFCLCLNKPWNRADTQDIGHPPEGVSGVPLLPSTASSPDPVKLRDPPGGFCIYLDPQDTEHLGPSGLLHFQYKQARLQALETMADVLKQRIDILTTKLHKSTFPDTAGDLAPDMLPLGPSTAPVTPTLTPPSYLRSLVSDGSRGTPQDWVDMQAKPLLPSTYFQDGEVLPWSPSWEPQSLHLGAHVENQLQGLVSSTAASVSQVIPHTQPCPAGSSSHGALSKGVIEERHRELEKKLQREMATLQTLGACMRSSLGLPAAPDPACGSLWQEEIPEAKNSGLVTPWTTQSCGQQEPKGPHSGGLHGGHLTNFQLKSLSFLESLKLDQQKQDQALALLRQRAEQEVWETQMALDELLFKHQLKQRMEKPSAQQRPEKATKLEQQWMCGGLEPSTVSLNTVTARSRSPPSPHRDNTGSSKHPEEARAVSAAAAGLRGLATKAVCSKRGLPEQKEGIPPQTTPAADEHLQPRKLKWADMTPGAGSPPVESRPDNQGPGKQPYVSPPGLLHSSSLDPDHQKHPAFPIIKKDGSPASQLKPQEAKEPPPPGNAPETVCGPSLSGSFQELPPHPVDPVQGWYPAVKQGQGGVQGKVEEDGCDLQTKPSAAWAVSASWAVERQPTDSRAWSLHGQCGQSLSGDGPCPEEARVAENRTNQGLGVSGSPKGEHQGEAHWQSEQQRYGAWAGREACQQENPDIPSTHLETDQKAASPAAPVASEEEAQPAWHLDSPPSQPAAILDVCSESASSSFSGSSEAPALSLTPSAGSASSLSCSSLQEFQKATATLVQLSNSSTSLSNLEAEDTLPADPSWSRELSAHDSWEKRGMPSFWDLHQGLPQLEGLPEDVGQVTLQRLEGSEARLLSGFSGEAAVAGSSEPGYNFTQAGWPLSFPHASSPRLGSELSESSSQIWDENGEENLEEPSPGVELPSRCSLPANDSLDLEGSGGPYTTLPSPRLGKEQEASRTSRSLTGASNTGETRQMSPVATLTVFPPQIPSIGDSTLPLSFPLDTPTSGKTGLSKANMPTEASAGYQGEPQDADTSPSIQRKSLQALPDPKAPVTLKAPSEDRAPLVTEVASPSYVDGFLTEILSPVDEELSYGSGDLPSSIHRDTRLPLPPPSPHAKSDINEPNPSSEDFPSPPEEAMFPGDSLDTLGEDTSITVEDMSSLSEDALEEALSLGPQKSGHCLGASGQDGSLDDSSSTSPLSNWVVSAPETSPGLPAQPLCPSPVACVTRKNLEAAGSQGGPWEAAQCFKSAEHQPGTEHLLDRRVATSSSPSWSAPSESPPPGPRPSVAGGQAESPKHTSKKEKEGQSCWTEGQPKLQGLLDRQELCRRDLAFDPASGTCVDLPGTGDAGPVDVVSTQLSRRILCDSLAALSGLAPGDNP